MILDGDREGKLKLHQCFIPVACIRVITSALIFFDVSAACGSTRLPLPYDSDFAVNITLAISQLNIQEKSVGRTA